MPITAITVENFKGIKGPVRIELKPITLLFGPNSAGKSTVIQALHYAREIFERENVDPDRTLLGGTSIDLGGFDALVHRHDKSLQIRLRLDLDLSDEDLPRYVDDSEEYRQGELEEFAEWNIPARVGSAWIELSIGWSELRKKALLKEYIVGINADRFAVIKITDDGRQASLSFDWIHSILLDGITRDEASQRLNLIERGDLPGGLENWEGFGPFFTSALQLQPPGPRFSDSVVGIHHQGSAMPKWGKPLKLEKYSDVSDLDPLVQYMFAQVLSSLVVGPGELARDALRRFCYLGPLRVIPPRNFEPARTRDESRWSNGMAAWDILFHEDEYFLDKLNGWLANEDRLNSGYRVKVKEYKELEVDDPVTLSLIQGNILDEEASVSQHIRSLPTRRRLVLWEETNGIELQPLDIGVGISQVVPVVVAGLSAKSGFVAIEQPELHIHPALQVALGDLFAEQILNYPDVVFILETHSEHLMLRFLRRIRETSDNELPPGAPSLSPESLSIYFSEQGENGITFLPIGVDRDGEFIDRWPRGFFNERVGELY